MAISQNGKNMISIETSNDLLCLFSCLMICFRFQVETALRPVIESELKKVSLEKIIANMVHQKQKLECFCREFKYFKLCQSRVSQKDIASEQHVRRRSIRFWNSRIMRINIFIMECVQSVFARCSPSPSAITFFPNMPYIILKYIYWSVGQ